MHGVILHRTVRVGTQLLSLGKHRSDFFLILLMES